MYMGRDHSFWKELIKHFKIQDNGEFTGEISLEELLKEIAALRGELSFYRQKIKLMHEYSKQFKH